jgi:hypothetical protein
MSGRKTEMLGLFLGVIAGGFALSWWNKSRELKDNKTVDTGEKTSDGQSIFEVTGVGGVDSGKTVRGYELPDNIDDVKLPITIIVKPNRDLFLDLLGGQTVRFESRLKDELVYKGKAGGGVEGAYYIWYPQLKDKALGIA